MEPFNYFFPFQKDLRIEWALDRGFTRAVIPATWEAETRGSKVQYQPGDLVNLPHNRNIKGLAKVLVMEAKDFLIV